MHACITYTYNYTHIFYIHAELHQVASSDSACGRTFWLNFQTARQKPSDLLGVALCASSVFVTCERSSWKKPADTLGLLSTSVNQHLFHSKMILSVGSLGKRPPSTNSVIADLAGSHCRNFFVWHWSYSDSLAAVVPASLALELLLLVV